MIIRTAAQDDIPALAAVHVSAWRAAYKDTIPTDYLNQLNIEKRMSNWQDWINTPSPNTTFIIEDDKTLVGFCVFGPAQERDKKDLHAANRCGEILALNIHPENWRCGYGKQLCQAVIKKCLQRQWKTLGLWTLQANEPAKQFYQNLGFSGNGINRRAELGENIFVDELYFKMILPVLKC